jgi:hypothetical protein
MPQRGWAADVPPCLPPRTGAHPYTVQSAKGSSEVTDNGGPDGRHPANRPELRGGPARIDSFDRELVAYVVSWAPFGGPPVEEILPRFGLSSDSLDQRIHQIVTDNRERNLVMEDRVLLLRARALVNSRRLRANGESADDVHKRLW